MRRTLGWMLLTQLGLGACGTGDKAPDGSLVPDESDEQDESDEPELPAVDDLPRAIGDCPEGAPEIGVAGGFGRWQVDFTWKWSQSGRISYGDPIFVRLADDVAAFAVSVDGGAEPTGFAWMLNDGQTVVDVRRPGNFARRAGPRRPATSRARDTWDTWWDTNPDTFDSWPDTYDSTWDSGWDTFAPQITRDGWYVAPFFHWPAMVGTLAMPLSLGTTPRPGCLSFAPAALGNLEGQPATAHVIVRRSLPAAPVMDVNLVVVEGAGISPSQLQQAGATMFAAYTAGGGPALGEVHVYDVSLPGGSYVHDVGEDIDALRSTVTADLPDTAINLFFVADFIGSPGLLGISSGIPGPMGVRETLASGVVMSIDSHRRYGDRTLDTGALGLTMAHEAGHQVGLFHTTEADGRTFDPLGDTAECDRQTYDRDGDGSVTAAECHRADGENLMFWAGGGFRMDQSEVSPDQAFVLRNTPIAR